MAEKKKNFLTISVTHDGDGRSDTRSSINTADLGSPYLPSPFSGSFDSASAAGFHAPSVNSPAISVGTSSPALRLGGSVPARAAPLHPASLASLVKQTSQTMLRSLHKKAGSFKSSPKSLKDSKKKKKGGSRSSYNDYDSGDSDSDDTDEENDNDGNDDDDDDDVPPTNRFGRLKVSSPRALHHASDTEDEIDDEDDEDGDNVLDEDHEHCEGDGTDAVESERIVGESTKPSEKPSRRGVRFSAGHVSVRRFSTAPAYDGEQVSIPNGDALSTALAGRRGSTTANAADGAADDNASVNSGSTASLAVATSGGGFWMVSKKMIKKSTALKRWFYRIPMLYRMIMIVCIPVIAAIVLAAIYLRDKVDEKTLAMTVQEQMQFHQEANRLMGALLNERGYIRYGWFLDVPIITDGRVLAFAETKRLRSEFFSFVKAWSASSSKEATDEILGSSAYANLIGMLNGLDRHRHLVLSKLIQIDEIMVPYDTAVQAIVSLSLMASDETTDLNLFNIITGFQNLQILENAIAIEREEAGITVLTGGFQTLSQVGISVASTGITVDAFETVVSHPSYKLVTSYFENPTVQAALDTMNRIRVVLVSHRLHDYYAFAVSATVLFDASTNASHALFDLITQRTEEKLNSASDDVSAVAGILAAVIVVSILLVWVLIISIAFANEALRKEAVRRKTTETTIWRFFPQEFMTLLNHSDILSIQRGDHRTLRMSILVADLRGFTTSSEVLGPDNTYDWLMEYIQAVGPVIQQHRGFIEKTLGDGIVALFSDPQHALQAAIDMQIKVQQININRGFNAQCPYNIGIGIHSGDVVLGVLGDDHRLMGTIVSDAVAIANKVESITKSYGAQILITNELAQECDLSEIGHRRVGGIHVDGRDELLSLIEVYHSNDRPLAEFKHRTREQFEMALQFYQKGNMEGSKSILYDIEKDIPQSTDVAIRRRVFLANQFQDKGQRSSSWKGEDQ